MAGCTRIVLLACALSPAACQTLSPSIDTRVPATNIGWALPRCTERVRDDADRDGIHDDCEMALARAFAPVLVVSSTACNWDASVTPARPGGGYYFAVDRDARTGAVRVAFLPAYYRDCGWSGAKCRVPFTGCGGHAGDSEVMIVEVRYLETGSAWQPSGVFLSSHCFARLSGDCRWYRGAELADLEWSGAAPVVWVAEGSNAGYPSRGACDSGHLMLDTCDRNDVRVRFPLRSARQNIGSASLPVVPGGCYPAEHADWGSELPAPGRTECFWMPRPFRGWLREESPGSTPYARYLDEIAGFQATEGI